MTGNGHPDNPAPDLLEEGASLDEMSAAADRCVSCDLYRRATQTVFGEGPSGATFLFVGEQPGDKEDREGAPFVGPAGGLLDRALDDAGIDRREAYVTNVVKHFKWKETSSSTRRLHAKPSTYEVRACRPWLDAEIELVDPAVVVCLGATAAKALLGSDVRVTRQRGERMELGDRTAMVTVHPSAILRARDADREGAYAGFVADLEAARSLSEGG